MKTYEVTFNKKANKERNRQNKEKVYKNNKYIEMHLEKYLCEYIRSI